MLNFLHECSANSRMVSPISNELETIEQVTQSNDYAGQDENQNLQGKQQDPKETHELQNQLHQNESQDRKEETEKKNPKNLDMNANDQDRKEDKMQQELKEKREQELKHEQILQDENTKILREKHEHFIQALERYGAQTSFSTHLKTPNQNISAATCWQEMSNKLNWPVEEVKLYAYDYMVSLHQQQQQQQQQRTYQDPAIRSVTPIMTPTAISSPLHISTSAENTVNAESSTTNSDHKTSNEAIKNQETVESMGVGLFDSIKTKSNAKSQWTEDECILMDTLLCAYEDDDEYGETMCEKIAARMPGRSPLQIEQRVRMLHKQRCK